MAGLLGSSYFTMNPTVPLAQIQAVLNLSTIGIDRSDSVFVMGPSIDRTGRNRRVGQVADSVNAALPSPLAFDFRFDTRSDTTNAYRRAGHLNYARRGVPVWFLTSRDFTGERRTPFGLTLISELDVGRVAELVYRIAMAVAMSPQGVR